MTNFICVECGTQFEQTIALPLRCPICEDERQFVRHDGQQWTTLNELRGPHRNKFEDEAPQLYRRHHSGRRGQYPTQRVIASAQRQLNRS
jgi:hypothetical protein